MSLDLRELYQEVILDHHKHPRNRGLLTDATASADGHNPLCGDTVTVYIKTDGFTVDEVRFEGSGCAISTASASMMTEALQGKSIDEVESLFRQFQALVTADGEALPDMDLDGELGDLGVLAGVRDHPVRIKCATLPWHTMYAALKGAREPVTTE
jgi:nitrogen fixation protein NifU and related proteins